MSRPGAHPRPGRWRNLVAWIVLVPLSLPLILFFNLVTLSAVGSAGVLAVQAATVTLERVVIADSGEHIVSRRRGPDETYCYGRVRTAENNASSERVRVYVDGDCYDAVGREAVLVPGVARPLSQLIDPDSDSVRGSMAFNGLFGMTRGAVIDAGAFWRGLWPYLFMLPATAVMDVSLVNGIRGRLRRRPRPGVQTTT